MMIFIRPEIPADKEAIYQTHALAFDTPAEAELVKQLQSAAVPQLISLVAENLAGEMMGHILFSPVTLEPAAPLRLMGLAPVAVKPAFQNQQIGFQLVQAGLLRCRELHHDAVVVLGHAHYYPRFGFVPAHTLGLSCSFPVTPEHFMVLELRPDALQGCTGVVHYHPLFNQ